MTFRAGDASGRGILVPCAKKIKTHDDLVQEAQVLWKAEAPKSKDGAFCGKWGCVAAMFAATPGAQQLAKEWEANFPCKTRADIPVLKPDGTLDIPWPTTANGSLATFDVILATATQSNGPRPSAQVVADAWANQCGNEDYFFNNVQHGIRTPDDGDIWRRIEEQAPCWLKKKRREYQQAIKILRSEAANLVQS